MEQSALSLRLVFSASAAGRVLIAEWLRISMDRISDSDSEDAGSIPAGAT